MAEYVLILVGAILVNNVVLTKFLGLCPFLGVSRQLESAAGMALATTFVLTVASAAGYLVDSYLLRPLGIEYLRTVSFILVIAATVQLSELVMRRVSPLLHQTLGIFLPLITSNCAILGIALLNAQQQKSLIASLLSGVGAGLGFALVLVLFTALRERIAAADVPAPFQGPAIALVTAGMMSLAFMGFTGLIQG